MSQGSFQHMPPCWSSSLGCSTLRSDGSRSRVDTHRISRAARCRSDRRKGGRPRKVDDADAAKARQLREKGITATDIAKMLGVSRATVYRYLTEDGAA
jgi:DNA invertase Pin-like site-specific DNA recombinase